jgi:hypothetical protein
MNKFFGRSKIDVDDPDKYRYLDPIWPLLENTPNQGITWDKVGKLTGLDSKKAVPMVQEICSIYQRKMMKVLFVGEISNINPETFWDENLAHSWLFDKVMLMSMKINTGIVNEGWDSNPYMQAFKEKWLISKGM